MAVDYNDGYAECAPSLSLLLLPSPPCDHSMQAKQSDEKQMLFKNNGCVKLSTDGGGQGSVEGGGRVEVGGVGGSQRLPKVSLYQVR